MTNTVKQLVTPQQLATTASSNLYVSPVGPTGKGTIVKEILLCNTTATGATVTVYFCIAGAAASAANTAIASLSVAAYETKFVSLSTLLSPTDSIRAISNTATAITMIVSGVEVS